MSTHTVPLFWGYTISDTGVVKYEGTERALAKYDKKPYTIKSRPHINTGYSQVLLTDPHSNRQRSYYVHRLVAHAFCVNPRPDIFNQVDHIDGNPKNNFKNNLRWVNRALNMINLTKAKNAYYNKRWKKWLSKVRGVKLGWFATEEEAMARSRAHRVDLFTKKYAELTCNA